MTCMAFGRLGEGGAGGQRHLRRNYERVHMHGYSEGTVETYTKPIRFWMACRFACQTAVPSDT